MAVSYANKQIVTDGLVLALDAGNHRSYPGSGTTWTDLSGEGNNGTLTNGPVFDSGNLGSIDFDGIDDYVVFPVCTTSITNITIQCWVNVILNRKGPFIRLGDGANGIAIGIGSGNYDTNGNEVLALFPGVRWIPTAASYTAGWNLVTMTLNGSSVPSVYVNTTLIGSYGGTSPVAATNNSYLGRCVNDEPSGVRAVDADISVVLFYDSALNLTEITQNYNVLKSRFSFETPS